MNHAKAKAKPKHIPLKKLPPLARIQEFPTVRIHHASSSTSQANAPAAQQVSAAYNECIDRAFRIPIFLSTANSLNNVQQQFFNRLVLEIEDALLFPRTLPQSEQYPETVLTNIRRLVISSYGMLAINFRRFFVQILEANVGQPPTTTPFWQGSTFSQIEPSMAFQFGLPILLVRERGTDTTNGIWAGGITPLNIFVEWDSDNQTVDEFFGSVQWREVFANWTAEVRGNYYLRTEPQFSLQMQ
ncbi:hypothetical protein PVOR_26608 [Paenibacillus vortex V453]|uniref:Uncharacterized protein n=1 Tax=Paenibacillus vortex V453 TaxID=715225 RepID=A0A2R9SPA3_9BACL|nr:hypothetical protein [Paenibacillus sp. LBL]AWP26294.1 hypothetical protein B9D94_06580 [Paenibacillus sp. Cedars]EFU39174.1 hypothetical protein PVOR_26608 [Paenibacillus vortex V453]MDH6670249.1 hypothetical protein [Paenibacillus sp. LBL]